MRRFFTLIVALLFCLQGFCGIYQYDEQIAKLDTLSKQRLNIEVATLASKVYKSAAESGRVNIQFLSLRYLIANELKRDYSAKDLIIDSLRTMENKFQGDDLRLALLNNLEFSFSLLSSYQNKGVKERCDEIVYNTIAKRELLSKMSTKPFAPIFIHVGKHKVTSLNLYVELLRCYVGYYNLFRFDSKMVKTLYEELISVPELDDESKIAMQLEYSIFMGKDSDESLSEMQQTYAHLDGVVMVWSKIIEREIDEELNLEKSEQNFEKIEKKCLKIKKKYPNSKHLYLLDDIIRSLHRRGGFMLVPRQLYPNVETPVEVSVLNVKKFSVELYKLSSQPKEKICNGVACDSAKLKILDSLALDSELVYRHSFDLKPRLNHISKHYVPVTVKDYGSYFVLVRDESENPLAGGVTNVSSVGAIIFNSRDGLEAYVADFNSGEPITDATFDLYTENGANYQFSRKLKSVNGCYKIADNQMLRDSTAYTVTVTNGLNDLFSVHNSLYNRVEPKAIKSREFTITSYTDRATYHPGDTVHVHSVIYAPSKVVVEGVHVCNSIQYPSNKYLDYKHETSNPWGGAYSKFVIPEDAQSGTYRVCAWSNSGKANVYYGYIRVENNTLPTSEIVLEQNKEVYLINDKVQIKCKVTGYDGRSMEGVQINYSVDRGVDYGFNAVENIVKNSIKTNSLGECIIEFTSANNPCNYVVKAAMLDKNGESREVSQFVSTSKEPYSLHFTTPKLIARSNNEPFTFKLFPINSRAQMWRYSISSSNDSEVLNSGEFLSDTPLKLDYSGLKDGEYKIKVLPVNGYGGENSKVFRIYSDKESEEPIDDKVLMVDVPKDKITEGSDLRYIVSTNQKILNALVTLSQGDTVLYREVKQLSRGTHECYINYNKAFMYNLKLNVAAIANGKLHDADCNIEYLNLKDDIEVVIDNLADEFIASKRGEIRVKVQGRHSKKGVKSNLIVTIYDKASDQIKTNRFRPLATTQKISSSIVKRNDAFHYFYMWLDFGSETRDDILFGSGPEINGNENLSDINIRCNTKGSQKSLGLAEIRDNFEQTVLFSGNITTNESGEAVIPFKLSDLLTTYKVKIVAITKDARSNVVEDEFVASKKVAVSTLVPKFIRIGDVLKLKTLAINRYNYPVEATVKMMLLDSKNRAIYKRGEQKVLMKPNTTQTLEWSIASPEKAKELEFKVSLESAAGSDIESHIMGVDFAVERIKASELTYIDGSKIAIECKPKDMLVDGAYNEKMSFTYSAITPMMIRMIEAERERKPTTVFDFVDKFYMSEAAFNFAIRYAAVVLNRFKEDAKRGSAESREWVNYFVSMRDRATANREKSKYSCRLSEFQCSDGGYSWLRGGESSLQVTLYVARRQLQEIALRERNVDIKKLNYDVKRTLDYLDKAMAHDTTTLSDNMLEYLELRSRVVKNGKVTIPKWDSYLSLIERYWLKLKTYQMAQAALVLQRSGRDISKMLYVLKQQAVRYKDMGTTFPSGCVDNFATVIDGNIAAHTLLMTLFKATKQDDELVRDMFKWLILQRKHQAWVNSTTTLEVLSSMYEIDNSTIYKLNNAVSVRFPQGIVKGHTIVTRHLNMNVVKRGETIYANCVSGVSSLKSPAFLDLEYSFDVALGDVKVNNSGFEVIREVVGGGENLKLGDVVTVRYTIKSKSNINMVKLRTMKCGAYEPRNLVSGYSNGYYRDIKRDGIDYYIDVVPRGTTIIEEQFVVWYSGRFSDGYAVAESIANPYLSGNTSVGTIFIK